MCVARRQVLPPSSEAQKSSRQLLKHGEPLGIAMDPKPCWGENLRWGNPIRSLGVSIEAVMGKTWNRIQAVFPSEFGVQGTWGSFRSSSPD